MKMNNLPNNWQVKSLGEVAFITSGQNAPQGSANFSSKGIPFIRAGSLEKLTNGFKDVDLEKIDNENANKLRFKVFPSGCVLFAKSGMSAAKDRVIELKFPAYIVTHLAIAKPNEQLYSSYLAYFLRKYRPSRLIKDFGYPSISLEDVARIQIPLPPLSIQKQIAEILEKADQAKQKRKEANKLTDEFLQSVFIEMFGDPVKNPKGWEVKKFGELGKLSRGKSKHRPRNAPFLLGGPYPLIQTGEIVNSSIYIRNYTQTYSEEGIKQSKIWPKGTLCISIAANIGFTAIMSFDACFPDSVVGFIPNENVIVEYIHFYFMFIQNQLEENAPQAAQKNINLEILGNLKVPVPPLSFQQQFAEIVNKTEVLKEKQKQSEQELENLFQSLMQKAFKGELVA